MEKIRLTTQKRETIGKKVKRYRKDGMVPAVLYGGKSKNATPLLVSGKEFGAVYKKAGESSLVELELSEKDIRHVLVHEVSRHPVTETFLHVDFYEVRMDEKIKTKIPLLFTGESAAVKNDGGLLVKVLHEIEIECLPADLPHDLTVDISVLAKFHDSIRVKDLKLPKGVEALAPAEETIALVNEPRSEAEISGLSEAVDESAAISSIKTEGEEKRAEKAAAEAAKEAA